MDGLGLRLHGQKTARSAEQLHQEAFWLEALIYYIDFENFFMASSSLGRLSRLSKVGFVCHKRKHMWPN